MKVQILVNLIYAGVKHSAGEIIEINRADFEKMSKRGQVKSLDGGKTND